MIASLFAEKKRNLLCVQFLNIHQSKSWHLGRPEATYRFIEFFLLPVTQNSLIYIQILILNHAENVNNSSFLYSRNLKHYWALTGNWNVEKEDRGTTFS